MAYSDKMEHKSEDKFRIEINKQSMSVNKFRDIGHQKFKSEIQSESSYLPQKEEDAKFVIGVVGNVSKTYETIRVLKHRSELEHTKDELSPIKVGSWRTKENESRLDIQNNGDNKMEIVKGIINQIIDGFYVKSDNDINKSIQSVDRLKKEKKSLRERKEKLSLKVKIADSKYKEMNLAAKDLGLSISIGKPHQENITELNRLSLRSENVNSIKSSNVSEVEPDESTRELVEETNEEEPKISLRSPLELIWCFGFNDDVPFINLSRDGNCVVLLANYQFPIVLDFHKYEMRCMHGHHNSVTSIAVDAMSSLIVTADAGSNNSVIVWDFRPCAVEVLKNVHPRGTKLVGLTAYSKYLITVSPVPDQHVQLWIWRNDVMFSGASKTFSDSGGEIKKLVFNQDCAEEFALMLEAGVTFVFYDNESDLNQLVFDSHQTPPKLGVVTSIMFLIDENADALSSTSKGYVIVWVNEENQYKKTYKKHIRLHSESIIHTELVDNFVAVATVSGNVSFYDTNLMILFWIKLNIGELKYISFHLTPLTEAIASCSSDTSCAVAWHEETKGLVDATLENKSIHIRHFIACSVTGQLAYFNPEVGIPKNIFHASSCAYTTFSFHPQSHYICAGTTLGDCILFDIHDRKIKVTQKIDVGEGECQAVSCLQYSPSGLRLACGMYSGAVLLLNPVLLTPIEYYKKPLNHRCCITHLLFSPDSNFLAIGDVDYVVALYSMHDTTLLLGRYQAHNRPITDLLFVERAYELILLSLGADRSVIEFHVDYIYEEEGNPGGKGLVFKQAHRVEQTAIPLCMIPYPTDKNYFLMVNSEFKFKLLDVNNFRCCKTLQAPTMGGQIRSLEYSEMNKYQFLMYATAKNIGLYLLPVDGNPYRSLACQISSSPITCCKIDPSGKYIFTISEGEKSINVWEVNASPLEEYFRSGGDGIDPFWNMLEGGRGGWRERDIREFFTVGQFAHQGERPSVIRTTSLELHACEIPNVFQALGFYPSKNQINNLLYELTGQDSSHSLPSCTVKMETFVQLYVNHRPCQELLISELRRAFHDLYSADSITSVFREHAKFSSNLFIEQLMHLGEEMTYEELYVALSILTDKGSKKNTDEVQQKPSSLMSLVPEEMTFDIFIKNLLGFKDKTIPLSKLSNTAQFGSRQSTDNL